MNNTPDNENEVGKNTLFEDTIKNSPAKQKKIAGKKKFIVRSLIALAILFVGYIGMKLFEPYKGSMAYGLCKVFVELHLQYPSTLKINSVEEFSTSVRIWYTHTDSFGEYILEPVQCYFKPDETYGFILDKATIRRRDFDQDLVEKFNKTLPVIFAHPPDLTLPPATKNDLKDLQQNIR